MLENLTKRICIYEKYYVPAEAAKAKIGRRRERKRGNVKVAMPMLWFLREAEHEMIRVDGSFC